MAARRPGGTRASHDATSTRSRRADIQGLRALAVVLVVAFHATPHVPGGFVGVDVFFAISGFVIAGTLVRELEAQGTIHLLRFYARRIRRLLPALAAMVAVVALAGILLSPAATQRTGAITGVFTTVFGANFYLYQLPNGYFDVAAGLNPLLHTWTLAVEEQFYLVFPALLLVAWRLRGRLTAFAVLGVVAAASFLISLELSGVGSGWLWVDQRLAFYGSASRAWEFAAGALLALAAPLVRRLPVLAAQAFAVGGLVAIFAASRLIQSTARFPGREALVPVLGACALLAAGTATSRGLVRLVGLRPFAFVGDLSYSWYLWHWPLIVFAIALWPSSGVAKPAAAVLSLVPAWLSYRYVESPIRSGLPLARRPILRLAAVAVAVPLLACLALLGARSALHHTTALRSWDRSQLLHAATTRDCLESLRPDPRVVARCTWPVRRSRGRVVLVGDSNAAHYTEAVVAAANRAGYTATVLTYPGCPFVDLEVVLGADQAGCYPYYKATMAELLRLRPSLVVDAARTDKYVDAYGAGDTGGDQYGLGIPGGPLSRRSAARARLWEEGLLRTLRRLNGVGTPVLVVHPIPIVGATPAACAVVRILASECRASVARESALAELAPIVRIEDDAVHRAPVASAVGFANELCGPATCASERGTTVTYWDPTHLSVDGARMLTGDFFRLVEAHARPRSS